MTKQNIKAYTIDDIAAWQTELQENKNEILDSSKITLPSLQRGFVWKPYQIEALWDSILRGYPVGAVLMSLSNGQKELLDGQQRSTSIALGFYNPFDSTDFKEFLNLKENVPSIWIDLKPINQNKYGLKYGIRVLTRSHPWGYQISDHRKPLEMSEREKALEYFRRNSIKKYTDLKSNEISPWDAYYPIPLSYLLQSPIDNFEIWKSEIISRINSSLQQIKTRHSNGNFVDYSKLEVEWLANIYNAIKRAKSLLIPEILVDKDTIEETENYSGENSESFEATLFIRLNSEGTRISGEELVYSLLKANFPELKTLVERIGMKFIAPSRIVNLFSRLTAIENNNFEHFQQEINITSFRKFLLNEDFKNGLKDFIGNTSYSEAENLVDRAISIISNYDIPLILVKEHIIKAPDLFLVLLVYLRKNKTISPLELEELHKGYHYLVSFNTDSKKTAQQLFIVLKNNQFKNWNKSIKELTSSKPTLLIPLLKPNEFETVITKFLIPQFIATKSYFSDFDFVKDVISINKENLHFLFKTTKSHDLNEGEADSYEALNSATEYWKNLSDRIYWNRNFLIFSQRNYFNSEFGAYMEFDLIEDTNRPWDWDHIYPNSWVYSKHGVSRLVRLLVNTNGNFRALSYNENRSQSNHQSPYRRFYNNEAAMASSFILENNSSFWLGLTDDDKKIEENNHVKISNFINACFIRMINLYSDWYNAFAFETSVE